MIKHILIVITIVSFSVFAQSTDSTKTVFKFLSDTTSIGSDSITINTDTLNFQKHSEIIIPIYSSPLSDKSYLISNKDILHNDYKYAGDYLRLFPFNFIKDLGFTGQPNETFLYGLGDNSISYLVDGISVNDRYSNSLNLNLIQSEDIDSIEIVPLPRGFLYGAYSNPVSVNFISKDFITKQPLSRIRFYQGANRDMMFDGSFNSVITKRLVASFDITNRLHDETYKNTDYSIWQAKVKLKYLLSNEVNIIASYTLNNYKAGYSGGVDIDSIKNSNRSVDDVLYDYLAAPMIYPEGRATALTQMPMVRLLITPAAWLKSDAKVYYLYSEFEKQANNREYIENKVGGFYINNIADYNIFNLQLNINYEKANSYPYKSSYSEYFPTLLNEFSEETNNNLFSLAGIISLFINDSSFVPSVFYKTSSYNNFTSNGYGIDFSLKLKHNLSLYCGGSVLKEYHNSSYDFSLIEIGSKYKNDFLSVDLRYFINNSYDVIYTGGGSLNSYSFGDLSGLGANLMLDFWKLNLESKSSYYYSKNNKLIGVPQFQTQSGLYYKDILFNSNLDLKTGFVFYYTGKNNVFTYENGLIEVNSSVKLDFTLVGEIQKTAIVYFTWQNLLGNNYYITPYYPMPSRSLRFGIAWELFN